MAEQPSVLEIALQFLATHSKDDLQPSKLIDALTEFKNLIETPLNTTTLRNMFIQKFFPEVEACTSFDKETKARILFKFSRPISDSFLQELRKDADVEVDRFQRIIKYQSKNLNISGLHKRRGFAKKYDPTPDGYNLNSENTIRCKCGNSSEEGGMIECESCKKWQHIECMGLICEEDMKDYRCELCCDVGSLSEKKVKRGNKKRKNTVDIGKLIPFLVKKVETATCQLVQMNIAKEFKQLSRYPGKLESLRNAIRKKLLIVSKLDNVPYETKVKILFYTSTSVDEEFLSRMKEHADVEVDDCKRITSYNSKSGDLKLIVEPRRNTRSRKRRIHVDSVSSGGEVEYLDSFDGGEEIVATTNTEIVPRSSAPRNVSVKREEDTDDEIIFVGEVDAETARATPSLSSQYSFPIQEYYPPSSGNQATYHHYSHNQVSMASYASPPNEVMGFLKSAMDLCVSQTQLVTELLRRPQQQQQSLPYLTNALQYPTNSSGSTSNIEETTSVKEFLNYLKNLIFSHDRTDFADLRGKVVEEINKLRSVDKQITLGKLHLALKATITIITGVSTNSRYEPSIEEADVLMYFQHYVKNFEKHQQFSGLRNQILILIEQAEKEEKKLPISRLHASLEAAIAIVI